MLSPGLTILDRLPDGFLDCSARDLHLLLRGPTLIELNGARDRPLFVSVLLHGNEDSGLAAIQRVIRLYRGRQLPRSLMLLVGNVEAARHGVRRLDDQPDYNRVWPGASHHHDSAEARFMAELHRRVVRRRAFAAIDLHNNTGRNPHYAVICSLDHRTLGLAALFSRRAVRFRGVPGTQTASFAGLIPAVTAECGQPGEAANAKAAARFVDAALNLHALPNGPKNSATLELYHTLGVVRVKEGVSFGFGRSDTELHFAESLDEHNFQALEPGTVLGETRHRMPLTMIDEVGLDVADRYFETRNRRLTLTQQVVPAMLSLDVSIVKQDCLCYLMERL